MDKSNMIDTLREIPEMIKKGSELGDDVTAPKQLVDNIVIIGMGGSGFNGDLLRAYLYDLDIPIHVVKDYKLPKYVGKKSLIFAISYSGNTEETITAYRTAVRRGANVIVISSGGKLKELAEMNKNPFIEVPSGVQPRISTPYLFMPILNVLHLSGIIDDQEKVMKKVYLELKSKSEAIEKKGKELASKLKGKVPIIYASTKLFALAEKWKTDINENAKVHAFFNVFPEFNHNEICGYMNPNADYQVVIINDTDDHMKIKERIEVFKKVVREYDIPIIEIGIGGDEYLSRLFSTIWMGFFMSYYLAMEYGVDPTPVDIIENFKKKLG